MKRFAIVIIAMLMAVATVNAQFTISLDFESQTADTTNVPSGWSYLNTGLGPQGAYSNSVSGGGSPSGSNLGGQLGGLLTGNTPQYGSQLPYSILVNSGSTSGFDVNKNFSGTYDFCTPAGNSYDSSGFLIGDIKNGTINGSAGQLLELYHSRNGFGNAPSKILDGTGTSLTNGYGVSAGVWYRCAFNWTAAGSGNRGTFSANVSQWNGSTWVGAGSITSPLFTFSAGEVYFGFANLWVSRTTVDNISITGSTFLPPPAVPTAIPGAAVGSVRLDWVAVSNATGYNIRRSLTNSGYVTVGAASTTNYTDFNLKFLTNYYYVVSATNSTGESQNSAAVWIRLSVPGTVITIR